MNSETLIESSWVPTWRSREEIALERIRLLLEAISRSSAFDNEERIITSSYAEILRTGRILYYPLLNPDEVPRPATRLQSSFRLLRVYNLLVRALKGDRNYAELTYTVSDPSNAGTKGILPERSAPLGVFEAENMSEADFRLVFGRILEMSAGVTVMAYEGEGDTVAEICPGSEAPIFMQITETTREDLHHWNDEHLDPYWDVVPINPLFPNLRSFWTYGRTYVVNLDFQRVEAELIRLIRDRSHELVQAWWQQIRDRGLLLTIDQGSRLAL